MSQTPEMKKMVLKKKVSQNFPDAVVYHEDDESIWFLVGLVSSKGLSWARLPYVQLLPHDSTHLKMRVYLKF